MFIFAGTLYKYNNEMVFSCIWGARCTPAVYTPAVMYISLKYITAAIFQLKNVVQAEYPPDNFNMVIVASMFYEYRTQKYFICFGGPLSMFAVYPPAVMYISLI